MGNSYFRADNFPNEIKIATIQYAAYILANDLFVVSADNVSSLRVGEISLNLRAGQQSSRVPDYIMELIDVFVSTRSIERELVF